MNTNKIHFLRVSTTHAFEYIDIEKRMTGTNQESLVLVPSILVIKMSNGYRIE